MLTGGPGTGKTTTVARLLALLVEQAELAGLPRPRIALAAPTGKAAARLAEAVAAEVAEARRGRPGAPDRVAGDDAAPAAGQPSGYVGAVPAQSRQSVAARRHRCRRDVDGVADDDGPAAGGGAAGTRLILVGDADQLASVEAGAVLADLVDGLAARDDVRVAALRTSHRFGEAIGALAEAIRVGDADQAVELLHAGGEHVEWIDSDGPSDRLRAVLVPHALRVREAALLGADRSVALANAGRAPAAVRAPAGPVRGRALEPTGATVAVGGDGSAGVVGVVCRAAAVGDGQRLRAATSTTATPVSWSPVATGCGP